MSIQMHSLNEQTCVAYTKINLKLCKILYPV